MTQILPPITQQDLDKVPISNTPGAYESFIENKFDNTNYSVKDGYIEIIGNDGKIRFVKRFDKTQTLVSTIYSNGIVSGLEIQPITGNTVKITAGKAVFPSGQKDLAEQNVPIPGGTQTVYYIFVDASNVIELSQIVDPDPTQLIIGCVVTSGTAVTGVFYNKRDSLANLFDRFSDLMYALGYFYSGFALTYNANSSSLYCTAGVVHNNPNGDRRWPSNPKITLQKVYYGNVFGEESNTIDVNFLKVISVPSGGPAPVVQNSSVFHFIYIARSTGKYYLLIADRSIQAPLASVTVPQLINVINSVVHGEFLQRHCVLLGAIGVYFNSTANTDIRLIQLHRGLSGARGIGTGLYPSPIDYPGGGILKARIGSYYLFQELDSVILQTAPTLGKGNYVVAYNNKEPNSIEFKEYGHDRSGVSVQYYCSVVYNGYGAPYTAGVNYQWFTSIYYSYTGDFAKNTIRDSSYSNFTDGGIYFADLSSYNSSNIFAVFGEGLRSFYLTVEFPKPLELFGANRLEVKKYNGFSYEKRQLLAPAFIDKMIIFQILNSEQPKAYKKIFDTRRSTNVPPRMITSNILLSNIRAKLKEMYSSTDKIKDTWSCCAIFNMETPDFEYVSVAMPFTPTTDNPPIIPIQPNDVAFLDTAEMDDDTLEHWLFTTNLGGVIRGYDSGITPDKSPYYKSAKITRCITVPYANLPYTGQPT